MTKLEVALEKTQTICANILGFADIAAYTAVETNLFNSIREGNL